MPCVSGLGQSPTVRTTTTAKLCSPLECFEVISHTRQYGTTCEPCKEKCSLQWTLFPLASPVRTSALWELKRAWLASGRGFFGTSSGLLKPFNPLSSFSKMCRGELEKWKKKSAEHSKRLAILRARLKCPHSSVVPIKKGFAGFV